MEKYGVLKEIEVQGVRFSVPLNATEEEIVKEASRHGVEMEKIAYWKEITDGGEKSSHVRSEQHPGEN
jgi:hypothetical protein